MTLPIFVCPKCGSALTVGDGGTARCRNGHCFDRAREGYYNFLLSRVGGTHGDNRAMIEARRDFLDLGYYAPLADAVTEEALRYVPKDGGVLDCGAGEGYYTDRVERALAADNRRAAVCAFDISKDAVRFAARRNRNLFLAVAGSYRMPVADASVDVLLCMFSPFADREFFRVLRTEGKLVMAIPAEEHLFGLKSVLYDIPYRNTVSDPALPGFSLIGDRQLRYTVTLHGTREVSALFGMTPYAYRTSALGREKMENLSELTTEIHFRLFTYQKDNK